MALVLVVQRVVVSQGRAGRVQQGRPAGLIWWSFSRISGCKTGTQQSDRGPRPCSTQAGWARRARFFDININGTVNTYKKLDSWANYTTLHYETFK
jgi:hypothetical protein